MTDQIREPGNALALTGLAEQLFIFDEGDLLTEDKLDELRAIGYAMQERLHRRRQVAEDWLREGADWLRVKALLPRRYMKYVELLSSIGYIDYGLETVENLTALAKRFSFEIVKDTNLGKSVLFLLAADTTPPSAYTHIIETAIAGRKWKVGEARAHIRGEITRLNNTANGLLTATAATPQVSDSQTAAVVSVLEQLAASGSVDGLEGSKSVATAVSAEEWEAHLRRLQHIADAAQRKAGVPGEIARTLLAHEVEAPYMIGVDTQGWEAQGLAVPAWIYRILKEATVAGRLTGKLTITVALYQTDTLDDLRRQHDPYWKDKEKP